MSLVYPSKERSSSFIYDTWVSIDWVIWHPTQLKYQVKSSEITDIESGRPNIHDLIRKIAEIYLVGKLHGNLIVLIT